MNNKKRVLVVDDDPGVLRFTSVSLSLAGYDVITTTSGEKGLKLVDAAKPDTMLLDRRGQHIPTRSKLLVAKGDQKER